MKPLRPFDYFEPQTLDEAGRIQSEKGEGAFFLAGGTDLLVRMKKGDLRPTALVNLKRIPGLTRIEPASPNGLSLGALASISGVEGSPLVREKYGVLAQAAAVLGSPSIRVLATLGGNIGRASPASDMAPPLLVLEARVSVRGPGGTRDLPLESIFAGPGRTTLLPGEVITSFFLPELPSPSGAVYLKLGRREGMDLALVGVAVFLRLAAGKNEALDARIALASVAPTPVRATRAEAELLSGPLTEARVRSAALAAASDASPLSDLRASASYRREMIRVLTSRAIEQARQRAAGGSAS